VVREVLPEVVEDEVLAGLVRLRHQIHLHRRAMRRTVSPNPNPIDGTQWRINIDIDDMGN
jgi:hypothetical protein